MFSALETSLSQSKFPIARYRFNFEVKESINFADYAGSAIRGAFGHSLRRISCMTHLKDCSECPLKDTCPYLQIFEPPLPKKETIQKFSKIPVPYVIEAPNEQNFSYKPGDKFSFDLVLIGKALDFTALIIFAMIKAMHRNIAKGSAEFVEVNYLDDNNSEFCIYNREMSQIEEHDNCLKLNIFTKNQNVILNFTTPLRIQNNGRILTPSEYTPGILLMPLFRRVALLNDFFCKDKLDIPFKEIPQLFENINLSATMVKKNWIRYSNRQKKHMNLGGYVGTVKLSNVPPLVLMFLKLGTYIHLGKNTSFGLGRFELLMLA